METPKQLFVLKRNGQKEEAQFDKIAFRIKKLIAQEPKLSSNLMPNVVEKKVIEGFKTGMNTREIDDLAAQTCAYMSTFDPDYGILAGRIEISNLHKETNSSFKDVIIKGYSYINPKNNVHSPLYSKELVDIVSKYGDLFDQNIDHTKDYNFSFFGFKVLERSYLLRWDGKIFERPQHMFMRVALGIHGEDLPSAFITYHNLSNGNFIHATPTLFNAGTNHPQMSSCFLLSMKGDSLDLIYDSLKDCAMISKYAGGIGLSVTNIRSEESYIAGTNGQSNGLVPMLKVFNDTARYVDQGGGKRKGSFAIYLEPWHPDILHFLDLKKNTGKEESRARDLFYAMWLPDLFMKRVKDDEGWSVFCPNECPKLLNKFGEEFEKEYIQYEKQSKARKWFKAREIWFYILESQIETGTPYILFKDACNRKSNQQNIGAINCSNLCTEIVQYSSDKEIAVCNLASVAWPECVDMKKKTFDHQQLYFFVHHLTINLNKIIDKNFYPREEAKYSNLKNRPIGIGGQGLADTFIKLGLAWGEEETKQLDQEIHETMYFAALSCSNELAKIYGPYESYQGSPMSKGLLQFDLWEQEERKKFYSDPNNKDKEFKPSFKLSDRWDWDGLRKRIAKYGVRNSLLLCSMPTASTSQILGNNECIEPYTSMMYKRGVLAGEFNVTNHHLIKELNKLGLWNSEIKNMIVKDNGSIQNIPNIPERTKKIYRTVWEISMKDLIDHSARRGLFIDQSQSFNCFMAVPKFDKLTSMFFYSWEKGLKTGCYYLRTRPAADPIKFTVDIKSPKKEEEEKKEKPEVCYIGCDSCGA